MPHKVILFHPRTFHEKNYRYFYVPYSLLSTVLSVDRSTFDVEIIDNNVTRRDDWSDWLADLSEPPLCVGINSMIGAQISDALNFAHAVGRVFPGVPRIWGGALPTVLPDLTATHEAVDIAVTGQGQETLPALLDALARGGGSLDSLTQTPGLVRQANGGLQHTGSRPFSDLNDFAPYRSVYDMVDVKQYIRFDEHIAPRTVNYHSSQGCPFGCGFCSEVALWDRKWSGLSAERIIADVEYLISEFGINGIKFYDAEFFINKKRSLAFAQQVVDRGLDIKWAAAVHPRNVDRLSEEELSLLARSGASRLLMGAESGVQDELKLINKKTDQDLLRRTARRCTEHGIVGSFSFVTGYPGSPSSHIRASLDFAQELHSAGPEHEAKVHFYAPYPGTPLYQLARQHGFNPPSTLEEWSEYDYYYITTPWIDHSYEALVREFNESAYPYLHPAPDSGPEETPARLCPLAS